MEQPLYIDILDTVMLPCAEKVRCRLYKSFHGMMTPSNTSKKATQWFEKKSVNILEWPAPCLNLWTNVKKAAATSQPTTSELLWKIIQ